MLQNSLVTVLLTDAVPNTDGQVTSFDWFDKLGDHRLKEIWNKKSGGTTISKFDYQAEDAVKQFLVIPVAHKPGTHFVYNTPGSFMLSAIVQLTAVITPAA